ncbi:MAG: helix-turn-helix transcriptional regulator [Lachnospiraceae bacterium]|nr:helix-turn-helix transcriptional regulator [Lachnospiraceae bacterium]
MSELKQFDGNTLADRLMEVSGLNQEQLGASLEEYGINKDKISLWRRGRSLPKADKLFTIARKFNCSIDYLIGISDKNPNSTATQYTARDVCRMLTEIDEQYHFIFDSEEEPLNDEDIELLVPSPEQEQIDFLKKLTRKRIIFSFITHAQRIYGDEIDTFNTACLHINNYLLKYKPLKESLIFFPSEKDRLYTRSKIEELLRRVPDELPPG